MKSLVEIGAANLVGIVIYLASAIAAIAAGMRMSKTGSRGAAVWLGVACFFLGLALFRVCGAEESLRQWLRAYLIDQREYESRRLIQGAAIFICLVTVSIALVWASPRIARLAKWQGFLAVSTGMLGLLYLLRIISLHGVDRLLYASLGPLHINHLLELLPIAVIWYAAWLCLGASPSHGRAALGKRTRPRHDAS